MLLVPKDCHNMVQNALTAPRGKDYRYVYSVAYCSIEITYQPYSSLEIRPS